MRHSWPALLLPFFLWVLLPSSLHGEPAATPPAEAFIPMRLAALHKGDVTYVQALTRLARAIEEGSNKQIRPELLANGKKGSEESALQEQFQGNLEGGFYSALTLARQLPAFRTLTTPLLFNRPEQVRAFVGSPLDATLRELAKSKNLLILGYSSYGFYGVLNFRPAGSGKTPSFQELTARVPDDPWMIELHQALGLRPSALPSADLSEAISAGWIQGVVATPELLNRASFANTNAAAFHLTRHLHGWMVFAIHLNWFNGLTPEQQELITKAAASVLPQNLDLALAQEQKILNKWSSENHFSIQTPSGNELVTKPLKALTQKHAQEMESLLNAPGAVIQLWNQNQQAASQNRREPAANPSEPVRNANSARPAPPPGSTPATREPVKSRTAP
ncbi:MAG: TRAP transporter substrate-binding protein DctP [Magnetococcales bacterium]|nr:TRAP transporter substrate-binding protein DctP [Magnetococcales bacterium]